MYEHQHSQLSGFNDGTDIIKLNEVRYKKAKLAIEAVDIPTHVDETYINPSIDLEYIAIECMMNLWLLN